MRGHITKRGHDSYTIVINLGRDPATGKRKQQWVSVKGTKRDAEKRLSELLSQLDNGVYVKPKKTTLVDYLELWLNEYAKNNLSPRGLVRIPVKSATCPLQIGRLSGQIGHPVKMAQGVARG